MALNIAALGAKCSLLAIIGKDNDGRELKKILSKKGVNCYFLRHWKQTIKKVRLVSYKQQIVRSDYEDNIKQIDILEKTILWHADDGRAGR